MEGRVIISRTSNPYFNLGLEEYLIEEAGESLYLWQNNKTIVIGRNQNPYKECNIRKMEEDKVRLARRRSGGGAVYHDLGNLNFTLISKNNENKLEENFEYVNEVLRSLGINSSFNGRNDLDVNGKKISGNAFYEEVDIFCHHGTLLIDVDMESLSTYLTASKLKLESKGIDSVKSRVVNLKDLDENITVEKLIDSFIDLYAKSHSFKEIEYMDETEIMKNPKIMEKVRRYSSWDWIYGESPESNLSYERKFEWGLVELVILLESGRIKRAKIFTDSIVNDSFKELEKDLEGLNFKKGEFIASIEKTLKDDKIKRDLINEIKNI